MKIAYLSTFYPYRGGIAQFNASLVEELRRAGAEVDPFTFTRQYPALLFPGKTQMVEPGDPAADVGARRILDSINPVSWLSTARAIAHTGAEVVIEKYWMSFFAPSLGTVNRRLPKSVVRLGIIDNALSHEKRPFEHSLARYYLRSLTAAVAMSQSVADGIRSVVPDMRIYPARHPDYNHFGTPLPVDVARKALGVSESSLVVLFFGFIRSYKGLSLLLDSIAPLGECDITVVVAGEAYGDFGPYEQQIRELGIADRVSLHVRYIGDGEVPVFFSAADICALPYKSATQSGIFSIAKHFRVPCVVSDAGGLPEHVDHDRDGWVFPTGRTDELTAILRRCADDRTVPERWRTTLKNSAQAVHWNDLAADILAAAEAEKLSAVMN